jgi:hypothetical protein
MKKILSLILALLAIGLLGAGYLVFDRYQRNPQQLFPTPYVFSGPAQGRALNAPIVLVGDRMGAYLATFKDHLAQAISPGLTRPIEIISLAQESEGLHRTLHQLKSLSPWPQIVIYHGGSEELREEKIHPNELKNFKANLNLYQDDRIQTALILYPLLSRFIYWPMQMLELDPDSVVTSEVKQDNYLQRLGPELVLFEHHLTQLAQLAQDRNSLLILTTTPINLSLPPKGVCEFSSTPEAQEGLKSLRTLMQNNDPKGAYAQSLRLVGAHSTHAEVLYEHGKIAQRMGKTDEAKKYLLLASAYDCRPWRASEVYNSIIRKVARVNEIIIFDFAAMMESEGPENSTFKDELHPEDTYYHQAMQRLGVVIKNILKL